uniref:MULE transposase domain-containing protein n=1 Tax=Meloidogyne incognita TaxID=6306 RepID=A0A914NUS1_MELIC
MGSQTEIKESLSSDIRPKLELILRRSTRKRLAPKVEQEDEMEDIVVDEVPEMNQEEPVQEEKEDIEFTTGCTNRGFVFDTINLNSEITNIMILIGAVVTDDVQLKHILSNKMGKIIGSVRHKHNHLPQPEQRLVEIKRQELKQRAREDPSLSCSKLIASIRAGCDDETFVALGSENSLSHMAQREKSKLYGKVNTKKGSDISAIKLPPALTERNGQSIFLYDSRTARARDKDAVFVFAHPYMLQQLAGQTTWTIGASFKVAPAPFKHAFVIGTIVRSQLIVAAYALLTENSEQFYIEALNAVSVAVRPTKPRRIIADLENSVVVAAQNVFPQVHINGCFFRLCQELFCKWTEYNLGDIYGNDDSQAGNIARMTFRRLICLAFIPLAYVNQAFYKIVDSSQTSTTGRILILFQADIYWTD